MLTTAAEKRYLNSSQIVAILCETKAEHCDFFWGTDAATLVLCVIDIRVSIDVHVTHKRYILVTLVLIK